jgi:hypothetical protein
MASAPMASVAGRTGAVTLSSSDVTGGSQLYFTDERTRAALSVSGPMIQSGSNPLTRKLVQQGLWSHV